MKTTLKIIFGLLLSLSFFGCTKDETENLNDENFVSAYGGKPFKGKAKGIRSEDGQTTYEWNGDGRIAIIETTADSASIVFMADFGKEGEINFKLRGAYSGLSYQLSDQQQNPVFMISDQRIIGEITNSEQQMIFNGSMAKNQAILNVQVKFKKETGAFPEGAVLDLTIDGERTIAEEGSGEGCQMRLVPIWSPNGITMGMVPDC